MFKLLVVGLILTIFVSSSLASLFGRTQSIAAKGTLKCGDQPAANVRVKLVDEDSGPDIDDELDAGYTDSAGNFRLSGDTRELTNIDPRVKIYHDCNDHGRPCQKKWKIELPDKYITKGATPKKTFDLGVMNLELEPDGQERDCIH